MKNNCFFKKSQEHLLLFFFTKLWTNESHRFVWVEDRTRQRFNSANWKWFPFSDGDIVFGTRKISIVVKKIWLQEKVKVEFVTQRSIKSLKGGYYAFVHCENFTKNIHQLEVSTLDCNFCRICTNACILSHDDILWWELYCAMHTEYPP